MNYCDVRTAKSIMNDIEIFGFINQLYNDDFINSRSFKVLTNIAITCNYETLADIYSDEYFPARLVQTRGAGKLTFSQIKSVFNYLKLDERWNYNELSLFKITHKKNNPRKDKIKNDVEVALNAIGLKLKDFSMRGNEIILSASI